MGVVFDRARRIKDELYHRRNVQAAVHGLVKESAAAAATSKRRPKSKAPVKPGSARSSSASSAAAASEEPSITIENFNPGHLSRRDCIAFSSLQNGTLGKKKFIWEVGFATEQKKAYTSGTDMYILQMRRRAANLGCTEGWRGHSSRMIYDPEFWRGQLKLGRPRTQYELEPRREDDTRNGYKGFSIPRRNIDDMGPYTIRLQEVPTGARSWFVAEEFLYPDDLAEYKARCTMPIDGTTLFPFTLEAEFDDKGYLLAGAATPNKESRVLKNWTWLQQAVDRLYGRSYTRLVPEFVDMIAANTLRAARGDLRVEVTKGVTVATPMHVGTAHGTRSLPELQAVVNVARASMVHGTDRRARGSTTAIGRSEELTMEVRKCRAQWYKNLVERFVLTYC